MTIVRSLGVEFRSTRPRYTLASAATVAVAFLDTRGLDFLSMTRWIVSGG